MSARLEELRREDLRRDDFFVAVAIVELAHEIDEAVVDARALRQEERHRRRDGVEVKKFELFSELAVIAGLRLLDGLQVLVEGLLRRKRGAVDALKHRVAFVPAPVCPCDGRELHGRKKLRRRHVGTGTKVEPLFARLAVTVEADALTFGNALKNLELVGLAELREDLAGFFAAHFVATERGILRDDRAHFAFDAHEVVVGKRAVFSIEVVVKTVVR